MRRPVLLAASLLVLAPATVEAQPRLLVGVGITSPIGDFKEVANAGYHLRVGLQIAIPTLPVSIRAEGDYQRLSEASPAFDASNVLGGAVSAVFELPGVGLSPYLLGGVGQYRLETGLAGLRQAVDLSGFHAGFGIALGSVGFVEIRYVQMNGDAGDTKYVPMTVGLLF